MKKDLKGIKDQIVSALKHSEAEDGLYFNNLIVVHEDEERPIVSGSDEEVLAALKDLITEGKVVADDSGEKVLFQLAV